MNVDVVLLQLALQDFGIDVDDVHVMIIDARWFNCSVPDVVDVLFFLLYVEC